MGQLKNLMPNYIILYIYIYLIIKYFHSAINIFRLTHHVALQWPWGWGLNWILGESGPCHSVAVSNKSLILRVAYDKPWQTMTNHEKPWKTMKKHEKPWKTMTNHDKPWQTMTNHDKPWQTMTNHDKPQVVIWSPSSVLSLWGQSALALAIVKGLGAAVIMVTGTLRPCGDRLRCEHVSTCWQFLRNARFNMKRICFVFVYKAVSDVKVLCFCHFLSLKMLPT